MSLAEDITVKLGGEWHFNHGRAPGPGHSKDDRSLKIADHESDLSDIVLHSFAGDDVLELKRLWRQDGTLPRRSFADHAADPAKIAAAKLAKLRREASEAAEAAKKQSAACWLYSLSRPGAGTLVESYLASRGIALKPLPETIRFLPASVKYPHPAMVVGFGLPDEPQPGVYSMPPERICGVHITYLKPDGSGKATVDPARKIIGKVKGSPIGLIPPNDGLGLLVGEGAETVLSGHLDTGLGGWAAGSAGFMPALADAIPDYIESVTVAVESDPAGKRGGEELIRRLTARGVETIAWMV